MTPTTPSPDAPNGISRKTLLRAAVAAGAAVPLLATGGIALARDAVRSGDGRTLTPTPYCGTGGGLTREQMEGPYFKPNSPLRDNLTTAGKPGTALTISGFVFGRNCVPLANVLLDFWQADNGGNYDNVGFTFRGHQFTDANGAYKLTTIVPGLYPGRTRHMHVKLQAPGQRILTTQTYFPGEPRNSTDTIYDPALLMNVRTVGSGKEATFDFVLNVDGKPGGGSTTPTPTDPPTGTWKVGTAYTAGNSVTYNGSSYVCLQAHTAINGWEPPNVPALWRKA
ncbi:carbohydrate-binding protein [Streptomyces sp. SID8352]|uniref:dioxygenase family protein n=1 Tax=Streptomyces sp. SID8352 TaxID=2690338 RepID=UPI0013693FB2|nr:carbohydrate-binding protein [Streptomyces sp. SID8352]MYU23865.1 dioxygenase [Streptomyces sp. SID8352]